jgi:tetratricopeptide (TPR) repeat protein
MDLFSRSTSKLHSARVEAPTKTLPVSEAASEDSRHLRRLVRKTSKVAMALPADLSSERRHEEVEVAIPDGMSFAALVEMAFDYLRQEKLGEASYLARKTATCPEVDNKLLGQLWTEIGLFFYDRQMMSPSAEAFREARQLLPDWMVTRFNLGTALHALGENQKAEEAYKSALEIDAKHPKVWCNLGVLHFSLDRIPEAEEAMHKAVDLKGDYARALDNLAGILGAQENWEECLEYCNRAVAANPKLPSAWFKIGLMNFHRNRFNAALDAFRRAEELSAFRSYTSYYKCLIHTSLGQLEEARDACRAGMEEDALCDMGPQVWKSLGDALAKAGRADDARECYSVGTKLAQQVPQI